MKKITVLLSLLCCASAITAQRHEILDRQLHTLQVVVNDDPLLPPIMNLGGGNHLEIGFDEFSHEYHRYIYIRWNIAMQTGLHQQKSLNPIT